MKKITLFFMSLFLAFGTAMAQDEAAGFSLIYMDPQDGAMKTGLNNIYMVFNKDITIAIPEGGIDVVNTETKEVVKITKIYKDEYATEHNSAVFLLDSNPGAGNWTCTFPAGVITSVDNEAYPETTIKFSIVTTFTHTSYSPMETTALEDITLTFDTEITKVNLPQSGMSILDNNWFYVTTVSDAVIGDDNKTVTLVLETPINTPGTYHLDIYQGLFESAEGINESSYLTLNVIDPTPRFETNYNDGDRVKELGNLEISFKNVTEFEMAEGAAIVAVLPSEAEVEGTVEEQGDKFVVTFDEDFTEVGTYTFIIPAGAFTMDGANNEYREINVELYTFEIVPLQVVSVTPVVGDVASLSKIVVKYNQPVSLSYNEDWQQISYEISLTCGEEEYTLTYAPESWGVTDEVVYLVNAEWDGHQYTSTTPIVAKGTYELNLADIVVDHAGEQYIDEWGYTNTKWYSKNQHCEGTYTWTVTGDSSVENIAATEGEQVIYDLLGRRVEAITGAGIYIVNGKKVIVK